VAVLGFHPTSTRLVLLCCGAAEPVPAASAPPPLSAAGRAAVEQAAAVLPPFAHIVASGQPAARETAEILAAARGVPVWWRDDLDELRSAESLVEGGQRLHYALMAVGDRFHGRTTLVVSYPAVLTAFGAAQRGTVPTPDDVAALPDLSVAIVDYVEGRFYMVQDFPVRRGS
jgi:broad specificity phosphatase PhoE